MDNQNNLTWVFSNSTLNEALDQWGIEQINAYPDQLERIQTTVIAMQHFLFSQAAYKKKMILGGTPNLFKLHMPKSLNDGNNL